VLFGKRPALREERAFSLSAVSNVALVFYASAFGNDLWQAKGAEN
jgi:hypothetical protein